MISTFIFVVLPSSRDGGAPACSAAGAAAGAPTYFIMITRIVYATFLALTLSYPYPNPNPTLKGGGRGNN